MSDAAFHGPAPHTDTAQWDRLVEAVGPDGVLVAISRMMGPLVRGRCEPEDVWQETLIRAWRDRDRHTWTSIRDYRSWLLTIARNRVTDAAREATAEKRGGGAAAVGFGDLTPPAGGSVSDLFPAGSVTPSRIAGHREGAALMLAALDTLPPDLEVVVRRHLFEELPMSTIAAELGIAEATAWYRLRKGTEAYARKLDALRSVSRVVPRG